MASIYRRGNIWYVTVSFLTTELDSPLCVYLANTTGLRLIVFDQQNTKVELCATFTSVKLL